MADDLNAREQLAAAAGWLAYQDENLSFGLRSAEDALKLWRYWSARPAELPEFCDDPSSLAEVAEFKRHFVAALGYEPFLPQEVTGND